MVNTVIVIANGLTCGCFLLQATRLWNDPSDEKKPRVVDWLALLGASVLLGNTIYLVSGDPRMFQTALAPAVVYTLAYLKYNQFWPRSIPWIRRKRIESRARRQQEDRDANDGD